GMACSSVSFTLFDREENSPGASDTIIDSPAETAEVDKLCYETNVLKFSEDSKVFESKLAKTVDVSKLAQKMGWLELDLTRDAEAQTGLPLKDAANTTVAFQGLPAIGFMIKNRDRGNPEINYVSTIAHAYTRETGAWTKWIP
uniref:hypothetical protein n=1 Tax=Candidatus Thiosymbion oneisti TaxID=589554 RepID=UPI003F70A9D7